VALPVGPNCRDWPKRPDSTFIEPDRRDRPARADLVQTLQTLCGSDALRIACKQAASRELGQLGKAAIVRSLSADADAPADCGHEKDLQMQVFSRAADGIRTHDLLHGKQTL
jgi:hypothetical protein